MPFYIVEKGVMYMPFYRKKAGTDIWHWRKDCSNWPEAGYIEEYHAGTERPKTGELCNECYAKEQSNECKT